jgi:ATP-dependent Clp protease ATP-binding subunit ClpC
MISFIELKHKTSNLKPIVILEQCVNYRSRYFLNKILFYVSAVLFFLLLVSLEAEKIPGGEIADFFGNYGFAIRALFLLTFSVWIIIKLLDAFFYSVYYDIDNIATFELARTINTTNPDDLTKSFFQSYHGKNILMRLGVDKKTFEEFLNNRQDTINDINFEMNEDADGFLTMADYGLALYKIDEDLQNLLNTQGITEKEFIKTIEWVKKIEEQKISDGIWWTREKLAKIPSLGRNWSFGRVYLLEKYGHSIFEDKNYHYLGRKDKIYQKYIDQLQNILLKSNGANAIIMAETSDIAMNIVSTLGRILINGKINTVLEDHRIFVLDGADLIDAFKSKVEFEKAFNEILIQADNAGNAFVVIPRLPNFIDSAFEIGVDVAEILSEFLSSSSIQIIALTDERGFHQSIETNKNLMQHFEKLVIKQIDNDGAVSLLEEEAVRIEAEYNILFTYEALEKISESAARYFSNSEYSDKILDLIEEIKIKTLMDRKFFVTEKEVTDVVALKTGVPQGAIGEKEKEKLSGLEELLHKRVIGQIAAIEAISKAIKRARSGIQNPNRPIGSFLFIGPTGVGKTETTKALAESFFGSEKNIVRFDMSEYNSFDALEKLIGGVDNKTVGTLSAKIRENQYGVLLLDEFEKADKKVHDLFLQIIDEGKFTDVRGEEINARNLIIIATSNAGSDLIYDASLNDKDLALTKDTVINTIIQRGIFKPELINRFDGVILFHALKDEHIAKIAKLMLQKLEARLIEKGIKVDVNEKMINYLVEVGHNPQFGARAMNRTIQDVVEGQIAEGIIDGKITHGSLVKFDINPQTKELKIIV